MILDSRTANNTIAASRNGRPFNRHPSMRDATNAGLSSEARQHDGPILRTILSGALVLLSACAAPSPERSEEAALEETPERGTAVGAETPGESGEVGFSVERLFHPRYEPLLSGVGYSLTHARRESSQAEVEELLRYLQAAGADHNGDSGPLAELGGLQGLKSLLVRRLNHEDSAVRGFCAVVLGILDAQDAVADIAALLPERDPTLGKRADRAALDDLLLSIKNDISAASVALGLLEAEEYGATLVPLLKSDLPVIRGAAASGLGELAPEKHLEDIVELLTDPYEGVRIAAAEAVAKAGAKEHALSIVPLLALQASDVSKTAAYCLAKLGAVETSNDVAKLLTVEYVRGSAAKALALMKARSRAKDIAKLIGAEEPLVRRDAVIALGILEAREYLEEIANLLVDPEEFVRPSAALALLLIGAERHREAILSELGTGPLFTVYDFHTIVTEEIFALDARAKRLLDQLKSER